MPCTSTRIPSGGASWSCCCRCCGAACSVDGDDDDEVAVSASPAEEGVEEEEEEEEETGKTRAGATRSRRVRSVQVAAPEEDMARQSKVRNGSHVTRQPCEKTEGYHRRAKMISLLKDLPLLYPLPANCFLFPSSPSLYSSILIGSCTTAKSGPYSCSSPNPWTTNRTGTH